MMLFDRRRSHSWQSRFAVALAMMCSLLPARSAQAAFIDGGWGARPVGMGSAFSAIADDANAPLFNPAGLSQLQWNQVSAMYARLFSGLTLYAGDDTVRLDQSYLAFASKASTFGAFGLSWANFSTTHLYREDTLTVSWGKNLGSLLPAFDDALSIGVNLKYLRHAVTLDARTANDPVFSGGSSAAAVTADAGLLLTPQNGPLAGFRFALVGQNLTRPDVGFNEKDVVPLVGRLGLAYQSTRLPWLVPSFDITRRNGVTGLFGGIESWLFQDSLGLRAGGNKDEASAGLSYYQAFGKKFGFRLDYGFTVPFYVQDSNGSHRVAGTVYFQ